MYKNLYKITKLSFKKSCVATAWQASNDHAIPTCQRVDQDTAHGAECFNNNTKNSALVLEIKGRRYIASWAEP